MTLETTNNNKPDYQIFHGENGKREVVGAVWKHGKGDGFNIVLTKLPVIDNQDRLFYRVLTAEEGRLTAFPNKEMERQEAPQ